MSTTKQPHAKAPVETGRLLVVGTPIGNLEDITLRALRMLREADIVAAEDTRHTRKLLSHYDIHTPLISYHEHNRRSRIPQLISRVKEGKKVALVSDAGMPGISDPGHELVVSAIENGIEVTLIPGPSALIGALVVSGLPAKEFTFLGFPPRKAGERTRFIERVLSSSVTTVLFEAPARLVKLLELIARLSPERKVVVARELTKKFEQVLRGSAAQLVGHFSKQEPLGECVLVIDGCPQPGPTAAVSEPGSVAELVDRLSREKALPKKEAMREAARHLGVSRRDVYEALLKKKTAK